MKMSAIKNENGGPMKKVTFKNACYFDTRKLVALEILIIIYCQTSVLRNRSIYARIQ